MSAEYTALVAALKELNIPVAENAWTSRPTVSTYAVVQLDFEADALRGDDEKLVTSWEGSVDLFSTAKDGEGYVDKIVKILTNQVGGAWSLNSHVYETETRLFHWEWTFEVDG